MRGPHHASSTPSSPRSCARRGPSPRRSATGAASTFSASSSPSAPREAMPPRRRPPPPPSPPPPPPPYWTWPEIRRCWFEDMADKEKEVVEGSMSRAEWEVVTLTASAYEAAPRPEGKPAAGSKGLDASNSSSDALLMSDHFVFPPSEPENLPIQTSFEDIQPEKDAQEESTSVEDYSFKKMGEKYDAESERVQFYDEGKNLSVDDVEMRDDAPGYGSSHVEDDEHGFVAREDSDDKLDQPSKPADSKSRDAGASCKWWLKKHMTCLYHQAKETNAIWSVVVAAALVGIMILGRWHKDKLHLDHLKWRSGSAVRG